MAETGMIKKLFTSDGDWVTLTVFCTFSDENGRYCIALEDGQYVCREIHWSPWKGTYYDPGTVSDQTCRIAEMLLQKADRRSGAYPFRGEHYTVVTQSDKYIVKKHKPLGLVKPIEKVVPFLFRLSVTVLLALAFAVTCIYGIGLSAAANLFYGLPRERLIVLIFLIQAGGAALLFLTRRFEWTTADLLLHAVIPYQVIMLAGLLRSSVQVRIAIIAIVGVSLLIWILPKAVQAMRAKTGSLKKMYWKAACRRCYAPFVLCICVSVIAVYCLRVPLFALQSTKQNAQPAADEYYAARVDLEHTKWRTYDEQKKLDLLQVICDYECLSNLGCRPPRVVAGHPNAETLCGHYNPFANTIVISLDHLKNGSEKEVLNTLLHEARHAYQHATVQMLNRVEERLTEEDRMLPVIQRAFAFRDNFDHYESGGEDYNQYYYQELEVDSRDWAFGRIQTDYRYCIDPTIEENEFIG